MPIIGGGGGSSKEIPSSVVASATAASYTVPAGFYAIVKAQVRNGGTFSVNGTVVLTSNTWNTISNSLGLGMLTRALNIPINNVLHVLSGNASYFINTNGDSAGSITTGWSSAGNAFSNATAMTAVEQQFKVPTGTVVVGAGNASYLIELYAV